MRQKVVELRVGCLTPGFERGSAFALKFAQPYCKKCAASDSSWQEWCVNCEKLTNTNKR